MPTVVGFQEFAGAVKPLKPHQSSASAALPNDGTIPSTLYSELVSVNNQAKTQQGLYFHSRLDGWIGACSKALKKRNEEVADHYQRWQAYEYNRWREEWHARNPRPPIKREKPPRPPKPTEAPEEKKPQEGPKLGFKFATNNAAALFIQRMWRGHRVRAMLAREKRLRARHAELAAANMFADEQAKQLKKKIDGSMETEAYLRRDIAALEMDNDAQRKKEEETAKLLDEQDARIFTEQTKLLTRSIEVAEKLESEKIHAKEQEKHNAALAFLGNERKADSAYVMNSLDRAYHRLRLNWIERKRDKYQEARLQAWAARVIQLHYRKAKKERMEAAWKAREDVIREKRAALLIQMYYRRRLQRKYAQLQILREKRLLAWAAIKIQRFYRERATERMLNLENKYRRRLGLTDATIILQSFFRMILAKRLAARAVARLEESLASSRSSLARSLMRRSGIDIKKLVENGLRVYNEDLRLSQHLNKCNKYISRWERMRAERALLKKLKKRVRGADDIYVDALLTPYVDAPYDRSARQAEARAASTSPWRSPAKSEKLRKSSRALEETLRIEVEHAFGNYHGMLRSSENAFIERLDISAELDPSLWSDTLGPGKSGHGSLAQSTKSMDIMRKSTELMLHVEEEVVRAEDFYDRDLNAERTDLSPPPSSSKATKARIEQKQKKLQQVFELSKNSAKEASVQAERKKACDKVRLADTISHTLAGAMDIYSEAQMDEAESLLRSSGLWDSQMSLGSTSPSMGGRQSVSVLSEVSETGGMPSPTRFHARSYSQRKADHGMQLYADVNEDVEEARNLNPHRGSNHEPCDEGPAGFGFKFFSQAKGGLASRAGRYPKIEIRDPTPPSPTTQHASRAGGATASISTTAITHAKARNAKSKAKKLTMAERLEKMTARTTSLYGQTLDIMQGGSGTPRHGGGLGDGTYDHGTKVGSKARSPEAIKRDLKLLKAKQKRHESYMDQLATERSRITKRQDQVENSLQRSWKVTTDLISPSGTAASPRTPRSDRHKRCHSPSSPYHSLDKSIRIRDSYEIF